MFYRCHGYISITYIDKDCVNLVFVLIGILKTFSNINMFGFIERFYLFDYQRCYVITLMRKYNMDSWSKTGETQSA